MMLDRDLFDFLEHTTDAAFAVTDGGEICSWNSSAEALFGFGCDEVLGKTCFEVFQGGTCWARSCVQNSVMCVTVRRTTRRFLTSISRSTPDRREDLGEHVHPGP